MPERIKSAIVDSYLGVIAVGWLFAEGIARLVTSFTTPLAEWMTERMRLQHTPGYVSVYGSARQFPFQIMIPQLIAALMLLLIEYLLLRWLYFAPLQEQNLHQTGEPAEDA